MIMTTKNYKVNTYKDFAVNNNLYGNSWKDYYMNEYINITTHFI